MTLKGLHLAHVTAYRTGEMKVSMKEMAKALQMEMHLGRVEQKANLS